MGKHSDFERKPRDFYPTPREAVLPLLPHLVQNTKFAEPCAGDGRLIQHIEEHGHYCVYACDIEPQVPFGGKEPDPRIKTADVLFFGHEIPPCGNIITNTPWEREVLHAMIEKFRMIAPTWLLFDAGWAFTLQAAPFLQYCSKIVTVGRISWEGNGTAGKEDCAWYLFGNNKTETIFIGKTK